jgi:hypothetical protein
VVPAAGGPDAGIAKPIRFAYLARSTALLAPACGRSSGVERNLAKVEVVGSNPIARSILPNTSDLVSIEEFRFDWS